MGSANTRFKVHGLGFGAAVKELRLPDFDMIFKERVGFLIERTQLKVVKLEAVKTLKPKPQNLNS